MEGFFSRFRFFAENSLKAAVIDVRVPAFEEHQVTGCSPLTFFRAKSMPYFFAVALKGFDIAVGDLDVGNARVLLHKLPHGLLSPMLGIGFAFLHISSNFWIAFHGLLESRARLFPL